MPNNLIKFFNENWESWLSFNNLIQLIGVVTGIWAIYLISKSRILGWWLTFPGIIASMIVFWEAALYGEVLLQVVFAASGILGIYNWQVLGKTKKEQELHVLAPRWYLPYIMLNIALYGIFYFILSKYTNSTTPHLDAIVTSISLVAQLMLTRQIFENWTLWIVVDVISVCLYWYKGIYLYSILYFVYLYLAIQGWYLWNKNLKSGHLLAK